MNPEETLKYFVGRESEIIDAIREIVEIESPSLDEERSKDVVRWVENAIASVETDLTLERIPDEGKGMHLIVRAFPSDSEPFLILGHTDTVHPIGTKAFNPTRIDGDRFYGCGIFDMKANVVLMIEVLRYFVKKGIAPSRPMVIFLSCDEEVGSHSGRPILEREAAAANACLVLEPSAAGRVKTGRKGTGMYTINAHGIPSHAGLEPEKGASAVLELSRQILELHSYNDPAAGTTVNVCTIHGGTTTNVIPEHAECTVDVRFTSLSEADRIDGMIKGLKPADERVSLTISGGINRPPMERTEAVAALYEKARNAAAGFGYELGETQVGGASDGNFVGAMGVPVLDGLGVTGDGAHTLNEYILVSDLAKRATLLTQLLK